MTKFIERVEILQSFTPFEKGEVFEFRGGVNMIVGDQGCGKSTLIETIRKAEVDFKEHAKVYSTDEIMEDYVYFDTESHNPRYMTSAAIGGDSMCVFLKLIREDLANGFDNVFGILNTEASEQVMMNFPKLNLGGMKEETKTRLRDALQRGLGEYVGSLLEHHGKHDRLKYRELSSEHIGLDPAVYRYKSHGQSIVPLLENLNNLKNSLMLLDEPETALSLRSQEKMVKIIKDMEIRGCQIIVASHSEKLMRAVGTVYSMEHKKWMEAEEFIATQV